MFKPFADSTSSYGTHNNHSSSTRNSRSTSSSQEPLRRRSENFTHAQSSFEDFPYPPYSEMPFTSLKRRKQGNNFVKWTMRAVLASPVFVLCIWSIGAVLFTSKQAAAVSQQQQQHQQQQLRPARQQSQHQHTRRQSTKATNRRLPATGDSPIQYMQPQGMQPQFLQPQGMQPQIRQPQGMQPQGSTMYVGGYMLQPQQSRTQNQVSSEQYMSPQARNNGYMIASQTQLNPEQYMTAQDQQQQQQPQQQPVMGVATANQSTSEQYMVVQNQNQVNPELYMGKQSSSGGSGGNGRMIPVIGPMGSSQNQPQLIVQPPPAGLTQQLIVQPPPAGATQHLMVQPSPAGATQGQQQLIVQPLPAGSTQGQHQLIVQPPPAGSTSTSQGSQVLQVPPPPPPPLGEPQAPFGQEQPVLMQAAPVMGEVLPPVLGASQEVPALGAKSHVSGRPHPISRASQQEDATAAAPVKQQILYYDPKQATQINGQLQIPQVVYDQQGNEIDLQALQGAQIFLEPPPQLTAPKQQMVSTANMKNWGESTSQDQSIIVSTVAVMALLVGALSARRMRSRSFLSSCIENETLEDDVAYDTAYTTTDNSYNTFGGWKGDLEKFDV